MGFEKVENWSITNKLVIKCNKRVQKKKTKYIKKKDNYINVYACFYPNAHIRFSKLRTGL